MNTDSTEPNVPTTNKETLETVMKDLEQKVNPKSLDEGLLQLSSAINNNDVSSLLTSMQSGSKEFEQKVGRPMTYSEMRTMWG
jgi:hypothetical protein